MKKLIIFGAKELGDVAYYYFTHDSAYEVVAFTLDEEYIADDYFHGLPVVPFANIEKKYPPSEYDFFVALSYAKLNTIRQEKYNLAKAKGYKLATYISSKASVWPDLSVGDNSFILENNTIQPYVKIGNNVTLWSGNHIGHHAEIDDHCFLASHIVVSGAVKIGKNCFIGVNATLHDHIVVAENCIIGAGSLLAKSTQPFEKYRPLATRAEAKLLEPIK